MKKLLTAISILVFSIIAFNSVASAQTSCFITGAGSKTCHTINQTSSTSYGSWNTAYTFDISIGTPFLLTTYHCTRQTQIVTTTTTVQHTTSYYFLTPNGWFLISANYDDPVSTIVTAMATRTLGGPYCALNQW